MSPVPAVQRPATPRQPEEPAMPIQVHCPNPVCARVHMVKNRYAGMRGKCPACGSWMYVPRTPLPAVAAARAEPAPLATGRKEVDAVSLAEVELPPEKPARAEP